MLKIAGCAKQINTGIKLGSSACDGTKQTMFACRVQTDVTGLCRLDPFNARTDTDFRPIRLPHRLHGRPCRQKCLQKQCCKQQPGKEKPDLAGYKHGKEFYHGKTELNTYANVGEHLRACILRLTQEFDRKQASFGEKKCLMLLKRHLFLSMLFLLLMRGKEWVLIPKAQQAGIGLTIMLEVNFGSAMPK